MSSRQQETLPRVFVSTGRTDHALRRALTKAAATHARADAANAANLRAARRRLLFSVVRLPQEENSGFRADQDAKLLLNT
jgi:hypothetical protein